MVIELKKDKKNRFTLDKKILHDYFAENDFPYHCQICKHAIIGSLNIYEPTINCQKCNYFPSIKKSTVFEMVENIETRLIKIEDICYFCKYDRKKKATEEPCLSCVYNIEIEK